ncbi:hypothetical protein Vafri_20359, partial [Volvox africanus]
SCQTANLPNRQTAKPPPPALSVPLPVFRQQIQYLPAAADFHLNALAVGLRPASGHLGLQSALGGECFGLQLLYADLAVLLHTGLEPLTLQARSGLLHLMVGAGVQAEVSRGFGASVEGMVRAVDGPRHADTYPVATSVSFLHLLFLASILPSLATPLLPHLPASDFPSSTS